MIALILTSLVSFAAEPPRQMIELKFSEKYQTVQVPGRMSESPTDDGPMTVRLDIPIKHSKYIWPGQPVKITFPQMSKRTYTSRIDKVLPMFSADETSRGARLNAFPLPSGTQLETIVTAEMQIPLPSSGARVPTTALAFARGRHYVIKKVGEKWIPVPVQIVAETAESLWILPVEAGTIKDGESILAKDSIFILSNLLAEANNG